MIVIAQQTIRFRPTLEPDRADEAARQLYLHLEPQLKGYFAERDLEQIVILIQLETGSTWVRVVVKAGVGALLLYGAAHQSADYLVRDARTVSIIVSREAPEALGLPPTSAEMTRTTTGVPGRLSDLFHKVGRGELSADEGAKQAAEVIRRQTGPNEINTVNDLIEQIDRELRELQKQRQEREPRLPPRPEPPPAIEPERPKRHKERRGRRHVGPAAGVGPPPRKKRGVVVTRDPATGELTTERY